MSAKAVVIAILFAVGLIALALFLQSGQSGRSATGPHDPPFAFNPASIAAIVVTQPDGTADRVVRDIGGRWTWHGFGASWPASISTAVQTSLNALADFRPASMPDRGAALPAQSRTFSLTLRDGQERTLRIATESLGGRVLAQADGGSLFLLDTTIINPLVDPGPASWRVPQALPGRFDASRITLVSRDQSLTLARLQGKWSLRSPFSARANPDAVRSLLASVGGIGVDRFEPLGERNRETLGLDAPRATITLETDTRIVDTGGQTRTRIDSQSLLIGSPATPDGSLLYASPDADAPLVLIIPSASVASISMQARNYLALTASDANPADVFAVDVRDNTGARRYKRELDRWTVSASDGTSMITDAPAVDDLLVFVTQRPAEPEPIAPNDDIHTLAHVDLLDHAGGALDRLAVGYNSDGVFAVRNANIVFLYPGVAPPELLGLPTFENMPPPAQRGPITVPDNLPTK